MKSIALTGGMLLAMSIPSLVRADEVSYEQDVALLKRSTTVIELADGATRVAICPAWQGRVMTSTLGGAEPGFGWLNREFLKAPKNDLVFNNYGGEDRFWLAPEAGQFALFFEQGKEQVLANWRTPVDMNEAPFEVTSSGKQVTMRARMKLLNASGAPYDLQVDRVVRLLGARELARYFGAAAAKAVETGKARIVGFETDNSVTNLGAKLDPKRGLVSLWVLGQFPPGPQTAIVAPFAPGDESSLGPVVETSYFGSIPDDRLKVESGFVVFRGDGQYRSKIGISQRRVRPWLAAIDFRRGALTLVHFTLGEHPERDMYVNNLWQLPQTQPYQGDVANSYNDGPSPGEAESHLGGFFELETLSETRPLATGEKLAHVHSTFHIVADRATLAAVMRELGVDLNVVAASIPGAK